MITPFVIDCGSRKAEFKLDLDTASPSDAAVAYYLQHGSPPEPELVHLMARVLKEGDLFVDGGANLGFFSLLAAKYVGSSGRVIAVEPGENNLNKLRRNIFLSKAENIELVERPLWSIATDIDFYHYQDSGANAVWAYDDKSIPTKMHATTLNLVCGLAMPELLKLDIEGTEVDALLGASELLGNQVPYIVAEMNVSALNRMGSTPEAMREIMLSYGYDAFMLNPGGMLPALVPPQTELKPLRPNSNILFSTVAAVGAAWKEAEW